jgi:hypothetical protein
MDKGEEPDRTGRGHITLFQIRDELFRLLDKDNRIFLGSMKLRPEQTLRPPSHAARDAFAASKLQTLGVVTLCFYALSAMAVFPSGVSPNALR